jgi:hypothetical protein
MTVSSALNKRRAMQSAIQLDFDRLFIAWKTATVLGVAAVLAPF